MTMTCIEHADYSAIAELEGRLDGTIFRYCSFKDLTADGGSIDATFLSCAFSDVDWYWGLFNGCLFVDTSFERCTFSGTSFTSCRFLNCGFLDCSFVQDNLGAPCTFDESRWFSSSSTRTTGLPELGGSA